MKTNKINKHSSWEYISSPNYRTGRKKPCKVLVYHYTAGGSINSCVKWFRKKNDLSAHFIIGRNGKVVQMVDLDNMAYHAGDSIWKGEKWVNYFSVGMHNARYILDSLRA